MNEDLRQRARDLANYLGVPYDEHADEAELMLAFGCDEAYLEREPEPPEAAVTALARMGDELTEHDRTEARRFAAYLAHATDD
jgi:hypothetical protein